MKTWPRCPTCGYRMTRRYDSETGAELAATCTKCVPDQPVNTGIMGARERLLSSKYRDISTRDDWYYKDTGPKMPWAVRRSWA